MNYMYYIRPDSKEYTSDYAPDVVHDNKAPWEGEHQ